MRAAVTFSESCEPRTLMVPSLLPIPHVPRYFLVLLVVWSRNSAAERRERERVLDERVVHQDTNVYLQRHKTTCDGWTVCVFEYLATQWWHLDTCLVPVSGDAYFHHFMSCLTLDRCMSCLGSSLKPPCLVLSLSHNCALICLAHCVLYFTHESWLGLRWKCGDNEARPAYT